MKHERLENVAESIGKLIINGYRISKSVMEIIGEYDRYSEITLEKRYAYYDDDDNLQGFDEYISININNGDYSITHKAVEKYKRYSSK